MTNYEFSFDRRKKWVHGSLSLHRAFRRVIWLAHQLIHIYNFFFYIKTFYQQIGLKFEEETSEMLRLEHGCVWCWNLDPPGNRSETPGKFWNVVLEKDGEDHVRNEEVLLRVNEQRNILHEIRKRKANWIGHINTAINLSVPYNASEILDYLGNYKISFSRRTLQAS